MKKIITLSAFAALTTSSLLGADVEAKLSEMESKISKLEAQLTEAKKTLTEVKMHDGNDNIKWDVDFRTSFDNITYTHASGKESKNPDLLMNRLQLGMGFAPDDNTLFKGKLSYNKTYGDTANHSQSNSAMGVGFANFDWVTNENATDNTLKVKEAYWLYKDTIGTDVPYTISIGRRPSTDGLGINLREGMKENSPLAHTVNVEFDGLSSKFDLDKVTGVKGMSWKLCTGRGMTNATPRFNMDIPGADYAADNTKTKDINMYGFIFVPYDNGQYSVSTNWARAEHMIGFTNTEMNNYGLTGYGVDSATYNQWAASNSTTVAQLDGTVIDGYDGNGLDGMTSMNGFGAYTMGQQYKNDMTSQTANMMMSAKMANAPVFRDFGNLDLFTAMFKAEGVGEGISDYLDDTKLFVSWAQSKTNPTNGMKMLGSTDSQTGSSTWIGLNVPCVLTKDGRIGIEWNKGSKNWRSVTYGEDTMTGSKIAARGTAIEAYYNKPINKALSFNLRYTKIKYDYTGSNGFFGSEGQPMSWDDVALYTMGGMDADPVKEATDLRASISYRF